MSKLTNQTIQKHIFHRLHAVTFVFLFFGYSVVFAEGVVTGRAAPDFVLKSDNGYNLRLSELRGQVVILNFWATWCGHCRQEMLLLNKLYARYQNTGFTILGINVDNNPAKARKMARKYKINFPILFDESGSVSKLYEVEEMPSNIIISRDGMVQHIYRDYFPSHEQKYFSDVRNLIQE